jgi:glycolate oxidase iron-sulfur subunit
MSGGSSHLPEGALASALSQQTERLSHCVHCGFCLPACPTYTRLGDEADSPRGRLHLMGAVVEGRLDPASEAFQLHMDRCLGCRACESVCPSGVEYGFLLERAREVAVSVRRPSAAQRILLGLIQRPTVFLPWMWMSRLFRWSRIPALLGRGGDEAGSPGPIRLGAAMLAASAAPSLRAAPFRRRPAGVEVGEGQASGEPHGRDPGVGGDRATAAPSNGGSRGEVALLTGCVQDQLFRRVNQASRRVLEANGWTVVEVAGQGCCGALHAHGGQLSEAREMARRNLTAFRSPKLRYIVNNAAGCGAMMREYHELLGEDARDLSHRAVDISYLLAGEGRRPRTGDPLSVTVTYDAPCHLLHAQAVSGVGEALLASIPQLELRPLERVEECCGGAGIYGITHPELGGEIGVDKARAVIASGADFLATGNPGCMMQIGAHLRLLGSEIQVVHPIELLDESYRRAGLYPR